MSLQEFLLLLLFRCAPHTYTYKRKPTNSLKNVVHKKKKTALKIDAVLYFTGFGCTLFKKKKSFLYNESLEEGNQKRFRIQRASKIKNLIYGPLKSDYKNL